MDISSHSLAFLALGHPPGAGWPDALVPADAAVDAAAWFRGGDADVAARITLPDASPRTTDIAALAQQVLGHLTA